MPAASKRGAYAKSAQRRLEIVDAAFQVFSRTGFLNATMSEIARLAGITVPGLTHHFPSKESLLEAVVDERDQDAVRQLEGRVGLDYIRSLIAIAERDESNPALTRLFAILAAEAGDPEHPAHEYFARRYSVVLDYVRQAFHDAAAAGVLVPGIDPDDAARACVALSDGLQVQALHARTQFSQSAVMRRVLQSFVTEPL